jgi:hypothetical protein
MTRFLSMKRLSILFLSLFAVLVTGTLIFQSYWVDPGERCERVGKWYDIETRTCATPIFIPDITGRAVGVSRAEASAAQNRELVELERQAAIQRRAIDAQVDAQRREMLTGEAP